MADHITVASDATVAQSVSRLAQAVDAAGARIFAEVDFAQRSASIGEELRSTTVVIFGSPTIGASALQDAQTMGLYLPLHILFLEDANGQTWATYDDPAGVVPTLGLAADHPAVTAMQGALARFSAIAAGQKLQKGHAKRSVCRRSHRTHRAAPQINDVRNLLPVQKLNV